LASLALIDTIINYGVASNELELAPQFIVQKKITWLILLHQILKKVSRRSLKTFGKSNFEQGR